VGDRLPALASLHHDGSPRYVVAPGGSAGLLELGDEIRLRVRAGFDAPIHRILLRTMPDGEQAFTELHEVEPGPACRWWEVTVRLAMPVTSYRFLVLTEDGHRWLNGSGLRGAMPTDHDDFRLVTGHRAPSWLADRVFCQVVPDRFANGDPTNDVATGAWTYRGQVARRAAWGDRPRSGPGGLVEFFGGDLAGIEARLDHLEAVGFNALYLTPVFRSRSNHGYDVIDYDHVAEHLGGDAALVSLRRATRERGMRLVLDITPNHVGVEHPWFLEARDDATARTAGRFVFRRHPDDYESWLGVGSLPKLDYRDPGLREEMYAGPEAIMRRWLREPFAIDGWRIDVANMLGRLGPDQAGGEVARGIRAAVKSEAPDAYLLGEHFYDATDQLAGDQWDGVMNYAGFMLPVLEWLAGVELGSHASGIVRQTGRSSTDDLVETLAAFRAKIPWAVAAHQYNLLGSHDTTRIRTALGGDRGSIRAAFGLLFGYLGVPGMLYGDEVGLEGDDALAARRTTPWDAASWDHEQLALVGTLARHRVGSAALRAGGLQVLEAGRDSLALLRDTDDEQAVVVVAREPGGRPAGPLPVAHGAIPDGAELVEILSGERCTVTGGHLSLPAMRSGAAIWWTGNGGRAGVDSMQA
jgi:alpha-glucosidase